jgi:hypothetical protein
MLMLEGADILAWPLFAPPHRDYRSNRSTQPYFFGQTSFSSGRLHMASIWVKFVWL